MYRMAENIAIGGSEGTLLIMNSTNKTICEYSVIFYLDFFNKSIYYTDNIDIFIHSLVLLSTILFYLFLNTQDFFFIQFALSAPLCLNWIVTIATV